MEWNGTFHEQKDGVMMGNPLRATDQNRPSIGIVLLTFLGLVTLKRSGGNF